MSVTEIASSIGEWSITLRDDTPIELLNKLGYFGHIAISASRVDPELAGDALLDDARYVGVLRDRSFGDQNRKIAGAGMAFWLGDEDGKGHTIETLLTFETDTFTSVITDLLPPSIQAGNIAALPGLYSGTHQFESRRSAIDYVCSLYEAEWRIRGGGYLDAGLVEDLYVTEPKTAIIRNKSGKELDYKALPGRARLDSDVQDFTTRVLLLAEGSEATTVTATADILPGLNPYLDLFGNPLKMTRIISESGTSEGNAEARAQLQLNRFTSPRDALKLSTQTYDIHGDVTPGDYVWVYDPDAKLTDNANRLDFYGQEIYPIKLRVFQLTWPVAQGMGVAFRTNDGEWIDLTDYVVWETGDTSVVVGGYNRSLTGAGGSTQDPGSRPIVNSTTPKAPTWNEPFTQGTYQSESDGLTRAQIVLDWNQPLNTDDTVITDGYAYEIRWRTGEIAVWPTSHEDMAEYQHQNLDGAYQSPVPFTLGAWQYTRVSWDDTQFLILDLTPGIPYDFQIRALDTGTPPNYSEWSLMTTVQTRPDTQGPSTPAGVEIVAGSRNAVQVVHTLGRASGGTFNLEADLNHLQIHSGFEPDYLTDPRSIAEGGTLLGKLPANQGMLRGQIPAIGTFQVDELPDKKRWIKVVAVDHFGNESGQSVAVEQTAVLIDSAFISELVVSKVSAGTVTATWIQAGEFKTADDGARVVFAWYGIEVFNINNIKTLDIDSATGSIQMIGRISTGPDGSRVVMGDQGFPTIEFFTVPGGTNRAFINAFDDVDSDIGLGMNSGVSDDGWYRSIVYLRPEAFNFRVAAAEGHPSLADQTAVGSFINFTRDQALLEMRDDDGVGTDGGYILLNRADGSGLSYFGFEQPGNSSIAKSLTVGPERFRFGVGGAARLDVSSFGIATTAVSSYNSDGRALLTVGGSGGGLAAFRYISGEANAILDTNAGAVYVKNFILDHPTDPDRWLVHACTETPEAAVEYSGHVIAGEWGELIEVELPPYFEDATHYENRQVWLQPMLNPEAQLMKWIPRAIPSYPTDGKFVISTDALPGSAICWKVKAVRKDVPQFEVEPLRDDYRRVGSGPYTWLEEN